MSFAIITDSPANVPMSFVKKEDITVIPFSYYLGEKEYLTTDFEAFASSEYYQKIRDGEKVTTSQVPPQKYKEIFEKFILEKKDIIYICLSSGVSGSYQSSLIAKEELLSVYTDANIEIIDSLGASLGEGLLVYKAAALRADGLNVKEAAQTLEKAKRYIYQVFTVGDLKYLKQTGRISGAKAIAGTILNIKPILKGNKDGKIVEALKVRGRKKAIETLAQRYFELVRNPEEQIIGISHCDCEEEAKLLESLIKAELPPKEIVMVMHEPATGSHIGPDSLAIYFEGDRNVRFC